MITLTVAFLSLFCIIILFVYGIMAILTFAFLALFYIIGGFFIYYMFGGFFIYYTRSICLLTVGSWIMVGVGARIEVLQNLS